jgi:hypothetical protein
MHYVTSTVVPVRLESGTEDHEIEGERGGALLSQSISVGTNSAR